MGRPAARQRTSEGGKVTVAGDSISVGIGTALRLAVGDTREVKVIGEPGTGLARPDSFDWPGRLEELARDFPPEVLVFSVGSNDAQDLLDADGQVVAPLSDESAWDREYSTRLARSFDAFERHRHHVVWLGHVRTEEDRVGCSQPPRPRARPTGRRRTATGSSSATSREILGLGRRRRRPTASCATACT